MGRKSQLLLAEPLVVGRQQRDDVEPQSLLGRGVQDHCQVLHKVLNVPEK